MNLLFPSASTYDIVKVLLIRREKMRILLVLMMKVSKCLVEDAKKVVTLRSYVQGLYSTIHYIIVAGGCNGSKQEAAGGTCHGVGAAAAARTARALRH